MKGNRIIHIDCEAFDRIGRVLETSGIVDCGESWWESGEFTNFRTGGGVVRIRALGFNGSIWRVEIEEHGPPLTLPA